MAMRRGNWRRVEPEQPVPAQEIEAPELEEAPESEPATTFIHPDCEFDGTLVLKRSIQIEGEFRGHLESADSVIIGADAAVEASITARTIVVFGAVVGDVRGSREVVLHPGSRLHGSVETPSLVIERGAFFNGQTKMYRPDQVARVRARERASAPEVASEA